MAHLNQEEALRTQDLQTSKSEVGQVRRTLEHLEIELQTELSKVSSAWGGRGGRTVGPSPPPPQQKAALEETLANTSSSFSSLLGGHQAQVLALEDQLSQMRADLENQKVQYSELLHLKTRLELEIREYQRLLEGELHWYQLSLPSPHRSTETLEN